VYKLIRLFGDIRFLVDEGESPRQEDHYDGFKRIKSEASRYDKYVDDKYAYRDTSGFRYLWLIRICSHRERMATYIW
jgi:hypothetical protein